MVEELVTFDDGGDAGEGVQWDSRVVILRLVMPSNVRASTERKSRRAANGLLSRLSGLLFRASGYSLLFGRNSVRLPPNRSGAEDDAFLRRAFELDEDESESPGGLPEAELTIEGHRRDRGGAGEPAVGVRAGRGAQRRPKGAGRSTSAGATAGRSASSSLPHRRRGALAPCAPRPALEGPLLLPQECGGALPGSRAIP